MNIYQDKGIAFGDMQYKARSIWQFCNGMRIVTSLQYLIKETQELLEVNRSQQGKKNYKQKTFGIIM